MPFTTSTLTQMASLRLGFSASKTMRIAQGLYEGKTLDKETVGLISYMRTDSTRLSDVFVSEVKTYISGKYGKEYVGYAKQGKAKDNVQDAHEAIRPTSIKRTPDSIKSFLTPDEYKLYNLIYKRVLASLMADAKVMATSVILDNNDYKFSVTGQVQTFDGYLQVYKEFEDSKDKILPDFGSYKSNVVVSKDIHKTSHFTEPPLRFTEDRLIKELESLGIGRPSTYVKIIEVLKERKYIDVIEKKFHPTKVGVTITDKLQEFFSSIINVEYTSGMETELDKVADGDEVWYELLDKFYADMDFLKIKVFNSRINAEPCHGGYKIFIFSDTIIKSTGDFHFVRRNADGTLSHRNGYGGNIKKIKSLRDVDKKYELVRTLEIVKPNFR